MLERMNMNICCEKMVENHLLYQNPFYAFRFPIALFFGIFLYGYFQMKQISSNSYIQQILIPLACVLVLLVLLDMISRIMISSQEKENLLQLCKSQNQHPESKDKLESFKPSIQKEMSPEGVQNINIDFHEEKFSNNVRGNDNLVHSQDEYPQPLTSKTTTGKCIQDSDCCNLCSGSNENPCNVVTAIPGPQWMPQTAHSKQEELKQGIYTPSFCPID